VRGAVQDGEGVVVDAVDDEPAGAAAGERTAFDGCGEGEVDVGAGGGDLTVRAVVDRCLDIERTEVGAGGAGFDQAGVLKGDAAGVDGDAARGVVSDARATGQLITRKVSQTRSSQ
jgi:hypothetical protein